MENVKVVDIPSGNGLDSITVFWRNWEPGRGQVTIICYGAAWTAFFGAMGNNTPTIQQFFSRVDVEYLVNKLTDYQFQKRTKGHEKYLTRIVEAVRAYGIAE